MFLEVEVVLEISDLMDFATSAWRAPEMNVILKSNKTINNLIPDWYASILGSSTVHHRKSLFWQVALIAMSGPFLTCTSVPDSTLPLERVCWMLPFRLRLCDMVSQSFDCFCAALTGYEMMFTFGWGQSHQLLIGSWGHNQLHSPEQIPLIQSIHVCCFSLNQLQPCFKQ